MTKNCEEYEFRARPGHGISEEQAQVLGPALFNLTKEAFEKNESFTAYDLVELATEKGSIFHPFFEWNNKTAAEAFRLDRARRLLKSCYIVLHDEYGNEILLPSIYNIVWEIEAQSIEETGSTVKQHKVVRDDSQVARTYAPTTKIIEHSDMYAELDREFALRLRRLRTEFIMLKKARNEVVRARVQPLFGAIEEYLEIDSD